LSGHPVTLRREWLSDKLSDISYHLVRTLSITGKFFIPRIRGWPRVE